MKDSFFVDFCDMNTKDTGDYMFVADLQTFHVDHTGKNVLVHERSTDFSLSSFKQVW